jgi:hypothetical protein
MLYQLRVYRAIVLPVHIYMLRVQWIVSWRGKYSYMRAVHRTDGSR